jgi:uncharacterized protein YcaQ
MRLAADTEPAILKPRRSDTLSSSQARRIALRAQGFGEPRSGAEATKRDLRRIVERLGVVQIDSVNVLARAHLLPAFSRLGCYRPADLHTLAYGGRKRALFEYWGHEASLLPVGLQPLFRWRMARAASGKGIYQGLARFGRERRDFIAEVQREIADRGALSAGELTHRHKGTSGWWGWSDSKLALEWLFWAGAVTTATRRGTFERVYDLTERVLPHAVIGAPTPPEADAQRDLLRIAARAMGVASERSLRDYFRLGPSDARARIAELVQAGELRPVSVAGWREAGLVHREAKIPRRVEARALLAPFDPLIWQRERAEALFGVRIRLELYTPKDRRSFGYYVLPFLLGDTIVARVDLKADRAASVLRVQSAHAESGVGAGTIAAPLVDELRLMAAWLGLEKVKAEPGGDLAAALLRGL